MFKRFFLGLIVVGVCGLATWAEGEEDLLSLIYERPYPGEEKARALKEIVEYSPLFLVEGEFTQTEAKTLGMKLKATKEEKKTISMCYPKVVLLEKGEKGVGKVPEAELLFLDKFGTVKKRLPIDWEEVFWSKNNKYLCVYKDKKIIILDAEGTELWSYKYFPITSILVSPSGDYVIEIPDYELGGYCTMKLYYANGKSKKIDLGDVVERRPDGYYLDISENGEYFAVTIFGYLILFNKEGEVLWKREGTFGSELHYFLKNQFIGAVADKDVGDERIREFCLYDIKGNLLWKNKVFLGVQDVYYEDEGRIYVISGWGHFFCFDTKSGNLLAKYSDRRAPTFFPSWKARSSGKQKHPGNNAAPNWRGIIISPDHSRIITRAFRPNEREIERIEIFDNNLKNLEQKEYPDKYIKWTRLEGPVMKFSKDNLLSIMTKEGLKSYEIK